RVVFYDYDEIEYMTDCNFRRMKMAGSMDDDYGGEVTTFVDKRDMFPEQWRPFLTGDPRIRAALLKHHADLFDPDFWLKLKHHADLFDPDFWLKRKERIQRGVMEDVFPYPTGMRFGERYAARAR
nr:bifunctional isocitrate dehydrogenase kinase/phosphatase [Burkholderiaceae bacterium]